MKQRVPPTILLIVSLVTFLLGTMLGVFHQSVRNSLGETPKIEAVVPSLDSKDSLTPLRIGVFMGVDGVTFSADGKKFSDYEGYEDREMAVPMSPAELMDLAHELKSAGLFEEAEFNTPYFISLPQTYAIVLAWPDEERRFMWITRDECRIPEKYLRIFERLNVDHGLPLIKEFIAYNRVQISSESQPIKCFQVTRQ
jgi:hypothetical protein